MNAIHSWALLASALGLMGGTVHAQDRYETARRTVEAAQALQAIGRWSDAQAQLTDAQKACGTDVPGRPCRLLVKYSTGYLSEKEAAGAGERRNIRNQVKS